MNRLVIWVAGTLMLGWSANPCHAQQNLIGFKVTLKRGVVCINDECIIYRDAGKGADHCWVPDREASVGVVKSIEKGKAHAIVEFASDDGWMPYKVTEEPTVVWALDYWGDPVVFIRRKDKIEFDRAGSSRLLSGEDPPGKLKLPIRIRCPLACISVPPPTFGDFVVRGPDWNKGSADGEPGWRGVIVQRSPEDVSPRGSDGYVTVEWEATKRRGRYRWDYHRKFDVVPQRKDADEKPAEAPAEKSE